VIDTEPGESFDVGWSAAPPGTACSGSSTVESISIPLWSKTNASIVDEPLASSHTLNVSVVPAADEGTRSGTIHQSLYTWPSGFSNPTME
jgi:hypothetical protein